MELIKKRIHYVREGKKIFDQFYVDEEYNVPEAKEDVRRIVDTGTELKIEEIRPVENYVRITGKLYFRILYLNVSSDPKPGVLEGKLPFEEMVYAENQEGEEFYIQNVRIEFTPSLIHSRKLSLRAMVELEVGREKLVDEETVTDAEGDVPLYKKMKKVQLLQLEVTKKDTYRIKEEITIPGTKESIGQILFTDISERKLELRPGLPAMPKCTVLIAKPPVSVSTKVVYEALDSEEIIEHPDIDALIEGLRQKDLHRISENMGNVLEDVTIPMHPVIEELKQVMRENGAIGAMMSGSGPTVFGLFENRAAAREAQRKIRESGLTKQVYVTNVHNVRRK